MTIEEIEQKLKIAENTILELKYSQQDLKEAFDDLRKYVEVLGERTEDHIKNDKSWMFTIFGGPK